MEKQSSKTSADVEERNDEMKSVNVRLSGDQAQWLQDECTRLHESQSTVIRMLIREKMEQAVAEVAQ